MAWPSLERMAWCSPFFCRTLCRDKAVGACRPCAEQFLIVVERVRHDDPLLHGHRLVAAAVDPWSPAQTHALIARWTEHQLQNDLIIRHDAREHPPVRREETVPPNIFLVVTSSPAQASVSRSSDLDMGVVLPASDWRVEPHNAHELGAPWPRCDAPVARASQSRRSRTVSSKRCHGPCARSRSSRKTRNRPWSPRSSPARGSPRPAAKKPSSSTHW